VFIRDGEEPDQAKLNVNTEIAMNETLTTKLQIGSNQNPTLLLEELNTMQIPLLFL